MPAAQTTNTHSVFCKRCARHGTAVSASKAAPAQLHRALWEPIGFFLICAALLALQAASLLLGGGACVWARALALFVSASKDEDEDEDEPPVADTIAGTALSRPWQKLLVEGRALQRTEGMAQLPMLDAVAQRRRGTANGPSTGSAAQEAIQP
jgi:hypothetical protein